MEGWKGKLFDGREELSLKRINRISRTGPMRSRPYVTSYPVLLYVEKGFFTYLVGDESFSLEPGDLLFCPPRIRRIMELTDPGDTTADYRLHLDISPGILAGSPLEQSGKISGCQKILPQLRQLSSLASSERRDCAELQRSLVTTILLTALCDPDNPGSGEYRRFGYREKRGLEALIRERLTDPDLLRVMIEETGLYPDYFSRVFRETYGLSPKRYITVQRLERAAALLRETDLPVYGIADECGYGNISLFNRLFRERFGRTPSAYRKSDG